MKHPPTLSILLVLLALMGPASVLWALDESASTAHPANPFGNGVLEQGSKGPEVAALQEALNKQLVPSPGLAVNGIFDPETEAAVREFQQKSDLEVDGTVGVRTKLALGADIDPYFSESSEITSYSAPPVITRFVRQDSQGNFWLATWRGIVHYDGTKFTNITNKEGLRRYRTFCILEDDAKNIWFGTTGAGVYRYDGQSYTNYTTKNGLGDNGILSMLQDRDKNIWFGGGSNGVTRYDGKTFKTFTKKDGFTDTNAHSMSQAPDGKVWLGTRGALFHYDGKEFVNFTEKHNVGIDKNSYTPVVVDRQGHVWFGGSNGLYHYDGTEVRHLFEPAAFALLEDSKGRIWFTGGGLEGDQPKHGTRVLNRFDPSSGLESFATRRKKVEVKSHAIFELSEDRNGHIWFGTGRGVCRVAEDTVHYYQPHPWESGQSTGALDTPSDRG